MSDTETDGSTVRNSGDYDDLVEALEEVVAESSIKKDNNTLPVTQQIPASSSDAVIDHWLQPDPDL